LFAAAFLVLLSLLRTSVSAQRLPWLGIDPLVADALGALRETDHWIASAIKPFQPQAPIEGRDHGAAIPSFDPTQHLRYRVVDMRPGTPRAVFLLLAWHSISGNGPSPGVIMQQVETAAGRSWHIACEFRDYGLSLTLLDRRSHGWRHFRVASGEYGWRPATGTPGALLPEGAPEGAMECVPLVLTEFPP
jgi:hypothetical protein